MGTYIPNMTDYIPQIQPFKPDYNFLGNILQTKQTKYDAAHKQLSALYGSILNAPLSRTDNIEKRDELFKQIDGQIKQVSGLDLSLQQNQDYAAQIFDPIIEDKNILKDMQWTKNWQSQMERAEGFKLCTDAEKCGGKYWDGGVAALNFKRKEFMDASSDEALSFGNASYVPAQNVMEKAMKHLKEQNFSIKFDKITGGYKVTTKNGVDMIQPLNDYLFSLYGSDPAIGEYYQTQSYVDRNNFVYSNLDKYGSKEAANAVYTSSMYDMLTKTVTENNKAANEKLDNITALKTKVYENAKKDKILESDSEFMDIWNQLNDEETNSKTAVDTHKKAADNLEGFNVNRTDPKISGTYLDNLVAYAKMNKDIYQAASAYSLLNQEQTSVADPYSLASYQSNLAMNREISVWDYKHKIERQEQLDDYTAFMQSLGAGRNTGESGMASAGAEGTPSIIGDAATNVIQNYALSKNLDLYNNFKNNAITSNYEYTRTIFKNLYNVMSTGDASDKAVIKHTIFDALAKSGATSMISGDRLLSSDQLIAAKELKKLQGLDPTQLIKIVNSLNEDIDPYNTKSINSRASSGWSRELWKNTEGMRNFISNQNNYYSDFSKDTRQYMIEALEDQLGEYGKVSSGETSPSGNNLIKGKILEYLQSQSKNGILPARDSKEIQKAIDYVTAAFTIGSKNAGGPLGFATNTSIALQGDKAFMLNLRGELTKRVDEIYADFKTHYASKVPAWNSMPMIMGGTNAETTMGMTYNYDMLTGDSPVNKQLSSLIDNAKNAKGVKIVFDGGGNELPESSDADALNLFMQWSQSLKPVYISPADIKRGNYGKYMNMPRSMGSYTVQDIAANSKDWMAFSVTADQNYIVKNILPLYDKKERQDKLAEFSRPMKVYIPKSEANNMYTENVKYTPEQWMLDNGKTLKLNQYTGAGNLNIRKTDEGLVIEGELKYPTKDGYKTKKVLQNLGGFDADANTLLQNWSQVLQELQQRNDIYLNNLRNEDGLTPEEYTERLSQNQ